MTNLPPSPNPYRSHFGPPFPTPYDTWLATNPLDEPSPLSPPHPLDDPDPEYTYAMSHPTNVAEATSYIFDDANSVLDRSRLLRRLIILCRDYLNHSYSQTLTLLVRTHLHNTSCPPDTNTREAASKAAHDTIDYLLSQTPITP